MGLQLQLLLMSMLFSQALALQCQQCVPQGITPCISTPINCSSQCATSTVSIYTDATQVISYSVQTCSMSGMCVNGSINMGMVSLFSSTQCCNTDFCNNQSLQGPQMQSYNGLMCYTCDPQGCSRTLPCVGDQYFCITSSVQQAGNTVSMKGCASKSICDMANSSSQGIAIKNVNCCNRTLCNTAESFALSFFLMFIPLLSSILSY